MEKIELICKNLTLPESPRWHGCTSTYYWVDILDKKVFGYYEKDIQTYWQSRTGPPEISDIKYTPNILENTQQLDEYPSYVTVTRDNHIKLVLAMESGLYLYTFPQGPLEEIIKFNDKEDFRCNDGAVDKNGRLLISRMNNGYNYGKIPVTNDGILYSFHRGKLSVLLDNVAISNGITWSLDDRIMYYIDSYTKTVVSYDYNLPNGTISNKKEIYKFATGTPDGMTRDNKGNLWIALYGGSSVICLNPHTKSIIRTIPLDRKNITSCTFGGRNLNELLVTAAKDHNKSGCVYKITLDDVSGCSGNEIFL